MEVIGTGRMKQFTAQGRNSISILAERNRKKSVIAIQEFSCYAAIKNITAFYKTMQGIYRVYIENDGILPTLS